MQVNAQATNQITTASTTIQDNGGEKNVFSSLLNQNISAKEISYEEYKELSGEDIDKLFPKDTTQKEKFKELEEEKVGESIEFKRTRRELVEDIISMLKRGFTVEELEYIEKLLAEIKKRLKEDSNSSKDEDKISQMLDELENEIAKIQKRITGEATIELNNGKTKNFESTDPTIQGFESRIDNIQKNIAKLKSAKLEQLAFDNKEQNTTSTKEELELIKKLKN